MTKPSRRLRFKIGGKLLSIEPALNLLQDADGKKRKAAAQALAKTFKENLRPFTLITNTLAKDKEISDRWRGFKDVADARHLVQPRRARGGGGAGRRRARRLSETVAPLLCAEGEMVRQEAAALLGPQRAAAQGRAAHDPLDRCARHRAHRLWRVLAENGGGRRPFLREHWIDAPVRPGKQPGAFAHPTVPSAHPYVLLNYQGKPRDVMTLAHELGHGVHQVLAAPNGALMAPTPLTLAETASVFGEMLTFKKAAAADHRQEAAQGHARRQGRGHDQHRGAADRVLQLRAQGASANAATAN